MQIRLNLKSDVSLVFVKSFVLCLHIFKNLFQRKRKRKVDDDSISLQSFDSGQSAKVNLDFIGFIRF